MEEDTAGSHKQIAAECNQEYLFVPFFQCIVDSLCSQVNEKAVREGVNNLGDIWSRIVILQRLSEYSMDVQD